MSRNRSSTLNHNAAYSYMVDMNQLAKKHNELGTKRVTRVVKSTARLPLT